MITQVFNYEGSGITFRKNGKLMVSATEMAKRFGKRPVEWLRLPSTVSFLDELTKVRKSHFDDLVHSQAGGKNPGTWFHEDVALEFARWLSPAFAIWCNDRIKELLQYGETSVSPKSEDEIILQAMSTLQNRIELQKVQLLHANNVIKEQAPKVEYYDDVLQSESLIPTTVIAKELGMSAYALNKKLHELKVIFNQSGTWVLYRQHQDKGYASTKTHTYTDSHGKERTSIQTYWTEKGRKFIHDLLDGKMLA